MKAQLAILSTAALAAAILWSPLALAANTKADVRHPSG
jgi:hypothetical protein